MVLFYLHVCILTPVRPRIGCWHPHSHVMHHNNPVSLPNRCHTLCRRSLFPKMRFLSLRSLNAHSLICTFRTIVMLPPVDNTLSFAPLEFATRASGRGHPLRARLNALTNARASLPTNAQLALTAHPRDSTRPRQQLLALAGLLASPIGVSDQTRVDFLKTLGRSAIKVPKKDDDAMDTVLITTLVVAGLFLRTC